MKVREHFRAPSRGSHRGEDAVMAYSERLAHISMRTGLQALAIDTRKRIDR